MRDVEVFSGPVEFDGQPYMYSIIPDITARKEADGELVFFVRDNGMGVDPRYREKIFGLFEKLDPMSGGSGLGLALVKRIVELHGGRLWG